MKKIVYLLLATISISNLSFSQETEFKFDKEGFTDFVVTQCEGKTQTELYKKALDWVSVTYKNPKEVIKAEIENNFIRIESTSDGLTYLIEISFKDDKYKFDVLSYVHDLTKTNILEMDQWYDNNGNIKNKRLEKIVSSHEKKFNDLNLSLNNYINNDEIQSKKNNW